MAFDLDMMHDIQSKIKSNRNRISTEEATKQWIILPLIQSLGYDLHGADVIPEFTLDVGVKKGEKIDYVLQVDNTPMILLECKMLGVSLNEKHISQLYRYFSIANVHIAILTNGDDYWFFTDSNRENVMDTVPYEKIRVSSANNTELSKFKMYSKSEIHKHGSEQIKLYNKYKNGCKAFANEIKEGRIPDWIINSVIEESDSIDIEVDREILIDCLMGELFSKSMNMNMNKQIVSNSCAPRSKSGLVLNRDKDKASNIKIHHEYVFNDYSDGDWLYHKMEYAIIFDKKYTGINARALLLTTIKELLAREIVSREDLLESSEFKAVYKIDEVGGYRDARYIEEYGLWVNTGFSIMQIVTFIEKLMDLAEVDYKEIKLSFRS